MASTAIKSRQKGDSGAPTPDLDRVTEVGEQLRTAFGALVDAFPGTAKSVAGMTRWLGIGRAACQRVMLGVRSDATAMEVVERFPGEKGLQLFLEAVAQKQVDPEAVARARLAAEAYARLVGEAGGSRARLMTHIVQSKKADDRQARSVSSGPIDYDTLRAQSFHAAQKLAGLWYRARVDVHMLRLIPDDRTMMERVSMTGFIGVEAEEESIPLIRQTSTFQTGIYRAASDWAQTHDGTTSLAEGEPKRGLTPNVLVPEFSTMPPPKITTRNAPGRLLQIFDLEGGTTRPIDIVVGTVNSPEGRYPALDESESPEPRSYSLGTIISVPTAYLLTDIYLEKELAQASIPEFGVFRIGFAGAEVGSPWARWFDRIPDRSSLSHLGLGVGRRPHEAYGRICDLTDHLVTEVGWDAGAFVGYRLAVPYPIWGMQYLVAFDFAQTV